MKNLLKLFVCVLALASATCVVSCHELDEQTFDTEVPASLSDIIGSWEMEKNGTYFTYTFTVNAYELTVRNVFAVDPHTTEIGVFTIDGNVIDLSPLEGDAVCAQIRAYKNGPDGLTLLPLGNFARVIPAAAEE